MHIYRYSENCHDICKYKSGLKILKEVRLRSPKGEVSKEKGLHPFFLPTSNGGFAQCGFLVFIDMVIQADYKGFRSEITSKVWQDIGGDNFKPQAPKEIVIR